MFYNQAFLTQSPVVNNHIHVALKCWLKQEKWEDRKAKTNTHHVY